MTLKKIDNFPYKSRSDGVYCVTGTNGSRKIQMQFFSTCEDNEWNAGHAIEAKHLGKGILERDLEKTFPDANTEIIMYCGGGFRSAMTCDAAQCIGYKNVFSLAGGYKAMVKANWPMKKEN